MRSETGSPNNSVTGFENPLVKFPGCSDQLVSARWHAARSVFAPGRTPWLAIRCPAFDVTFDGKCPAACTFQR
jgi:hypothetical protein